MSTRNSGRSFKNRVELQNSCLALGHANTFIPSTLNGSCVQNGKVSEEILKKDMDLEIDVCISRVDKCPCAGTVISLYKGACSTDLQHERVAIKTFLKGKREEKHKLTVGVAEDAYDVFLAIAISVLSMLHVVNNLIASIPYAELKSHKKDSGIQVVPHCRSCHYRLQILLGHMVIRLVKNAKASVRTITLSPTSW